MEKGTYASSKAACEVLSEGIRRELAPFGVKVVTIMQGAIATTVHNDSPMMPLPEGSLYTTIAKEFEDRIRGKGVVTILGSRDVFAKRVVSDLLKGATGRIYRGNLSTVMTLLENWLPEWIMVSLSVPCHSFIRKRHIEQKRHRIVSLLAEQDWLLCQGISAIMRVSNQRLWSDSTFS